MKSSEFALKKRLLLVPELALAVKSDLAVMPCLEERITLLEQALMARVRL
ncbi:MAG: hypothetical protein ACREX9_21420 [Gammaproteobacteria bacterium]